METGSLLTLEKTDNEHVASKPIPLIDSGATLFWSMARWTQRQMQRQMSVVDCSYVFGHWVSKDPEQELKLCSLTYIVSLLRLPETNVF